MFGLVKIGPICSCTAACCGCVRSQQNSTPEPVFEEARQRRLFDLPRLRVEDRPWVKMKRYPRSFRAR